MNLLERIYGVLKNQIELRGDIERTSARVDELRLDVFNHEKRLIRIETLVEVARGDFGVRRLPPE